MKRNTLVALILISAIIVVFSIIVLWRFYIPTSYSVRIEVTIAHPVTKQLGISAYTFKLYPYPIGEELSGMYMLRVEKGNDFQAKVIVSGHTYRFLDLDVHVVKLTSGGVLLEVKIAE